MRIKLVVIPSEFGAEKTGSASSARTIADILPNRPGQKSIEWDIETVKLPTREFGRELKSSGVWFLQQNLSVIDTSFTQLVNSIETADNLICVGGDHSISIGSVLAANKHCIKNKKRLGLLWLDAHPDLNTPDTSPSGRMHGMALATIIGMNRLKQLASFTFLPASSVYLLGVQSIDSREEQNLNLAVQNGMIFTSRNQVDNLNFLLIKEWAEQFDQIYLSLDLDVFHTSIASGVNAACDNGLDVADFQKILNAIPDAKLKFLDIVEYNQLFDRENRTLRTIEIVTDMYVEKVRTGNHDAKPNKTAPLR